MSKQKRARARRMAIRKQPAVTKVAGRAAGTTIRRWLSKGRG